MSIVDHPSLNPNRFELQGGVIGIDGTDIRISCEKIAMSHGTQAVESTHPSYFDHESGVGSVSGDNHPVFFGNQYVTTPIDIIGEYTGPDPTGVRTAMEEGVALEVEIQLDEGISYAGELLILKATIGETRDGDKVSLVVSGIFTGAVTGEQTAANVSRTPTLLLDRKIGSSFTLGIQQRKDTSGTRPWTARGMANANVSLEHACDLAIAKAGGHGATYPEKPWLQLASASAVWQGRDVIVGQLHYSADGPMGFCNRGVRVFSGWLDQKRRQPTAVGSSSGANACDVISGFGLSVSSYVKLRKGYKIYQFPCLWDTQPDETAYLNTINSAPFVIKGKSYGAYQVRWDPLEDVQEFVRGDGSTRWTGYIQVSVKHDEWTDHKIHCVATVKLPPVGGQSEGGAAAIYGWLQVYMYPTSSFPTLAAFCPNCAANYPA